MVLHFLQHYLVRKYVLVSVPYFNFLKSWISVAS
uniref:Uncharacterized protein n=1 Tax=CrAss-like virus sp. ctYsL76 TaxID=2826826 RepID=A0A8S5QMV1_9CAUD|nr:MAG TPA: hypothetical protein [CrAss-like virus sp. ctYsL76]